MSLTNLQKQWKLAASLFNLQLQISPTILLGNKGQVVPDVWLKGYGAKLGMLVFTDDAAVREQEEAMVASGYGYSYMSEPPEKEVEDLEGFGELLEDWGRSDGLDG